MALVRSAKMDKRAFPRYRTEVVVDFTAAETKVTGLTRDVSLGGMFVRTTRLPMQGQKLLLTLRFPDRQLLLQGVVVRTSEPSTFGRPLAPTGFAVTINDGESYKRFVSSVAPKI